MSSPTPIIKRNALRTDKITDNVENTRSQILKRMIKLKNCSSSVLKGKILSTQNSSVKVIEGNLSLAG